MLEERAAQMRLHRLDQPPASLSLQILGDRYWSPDSARPASWLQVLRIKIQHRPKSRGWMSILWKGRKGYLAVRSSDRDSAIGRAEIQAYNSIHRVLSSSKVTRGS